MGIGNAARFLGRAASYRNFCLVHFGEFGKPSGQVFVGGDVVGHFTVVKAFVGEKVKISGTGKTEYDNLFFSGFFAF